MAALAAASAAYWGLKAWSPSTPAVAPALAVAWAQPVGPQVLARALGGGMSSAPVVSAEGPAPAISRYALVGVVAGRSHGGAALISVDGQDAKPVRVGSVVEGEVVLQSVTGRRAVLSSGAQTQSDMTLELPPLDN